MIQPRNPQEKNLPNSGTNPPRNSLKRFLDYVLPYRGIIFLGIFFGIIRYLIPLVMPWTLKVMVDEYLGPASVRTHGELFLLLGGLVLLQIVYAVVSYYRSYLGGLAGHKMIFDLRQRLS